MFRSSVNSIRILAAALCLGIVLSGCSGRQAQPPSAQPQPPSAQAQPPSAQPQPPSAQAQPPSAQAQPPSAQAQPPSAQPQPPSAQAQPPEVRPQPPSAQPQPPEVRPRADREGLAAETLTESAFQTQPEAGFSINGEGATLEERIPAPGGYRRMEAEEGSFQAYMRELPMKADKSPVLLYDGSGKGNQGAHAAVFAMPVFDSDLQQCADSIIRVYAEYFWSTGEYNRIAFHLTNGFLMDYPSWREGNRLSVSGNEVTWVKKASYDDSYDTFLLYLKYVMMYAGTLSLDNESTPVDIKQMQAGDMFIKGGSPGHCVMAADLAVNEEGGICFLLAQGYMPAQDFHVLNNPLHEDDPWYYASELAYPLLTPEYVFQEGSLKRWCQMETESR